LPVTATSGTSLASPNYAAMQPTLLICAECGRHDDERVRGWQGHLVDLDDDGHDEVVFFCPRCVAREFGSFEYAE